MKARSLFLLLAGLLAVTVGAAENFDDALKRAATDYATRLRQAADELNRTRERIALEKSPLLKELRASEDLIISLEREAVRLKTGQEDAAGNKRRLLRDIEEQRKTTAYVTTLAGDALKALSSGLPPGEQGLVGDTLQSLQEKLDAAVAAGTGAAASLDIAEFMFARTERVLGGHLTAASALNAGDNRLEEGTLAFAGPEVFFAPKGGGPAGLVRLREGSRQPVYYPQSEWPAAESAAFFAGQLGAMPADPTGGKALRLQQTAGSVGEYISKGGKVAWVIVAVGLGALLLIVHKFWDVATMRVDSSGRVAAFLRAVSSGARGEASAALNGLGRTTREIFAEGLRHLDSPAGILEEKLEAVLLGQRLHFERRLPLLAVIATAAPLMGLLGTVVGMVKTFTLITVFGTGNAAKLSSGISEVLVATELGLAVAIPALVVHGFLAHRINKNLALLERQALEFVTAATSAQSGVVPAKEDR
ncbi:MAG: biopolymer transport protein ExbB [Verrucomicrobiota bacterium]|nr:biopolymer transport protein ExbB [Verrucomicrobiota bacterium]